MGMFDKFASTRQKAGDMAARHQSKLVGATNNVASGITNAIGSALGLGGGGGAPAPAAAAPGGGAPGGGAPAPMYGGQGATFGGGGGLSTDYASGPSNVQGEFQKAWVPQHLQGSQVGGMQQALLASLFGDQGVSRQFLNQDLANIQSSTQQQQKDFAGNARFRGSGVGAAIGQAVGQAGTAMQSRRMAQADQEELQRALALSGAVSRDFTNPLLSGLGMAQGGFENMMGRAAADAAQPSGFETGMSMATGLLDAYMPG